VDDSLLVEGLCLIMSSETLPVPKMPLRGEQIHVSAAAPNSSLWDRISSWASEHKAVVYTVAGVAIVVTGAGVVYYLTDSVRACANKYIFALAWVTADNWL
jgi:hypothetical protein